MTLQPKDAPAAVLHTVLIVDDDKGQLLRLAHLIESSGYHALLANNCNEAIKITEHTLPDIILSDVMMEGMDGYEFAIFCKGDTRLRHVPIILQSSIFNGAKDRLLAEAIGVDAILDKGMHTDNLLETISKVLITHDGGQEVEFDETKFLRMRAQVMSEKIGLKVNELQSERHRANTLAQQLQTITDALPDLIAEVGLDYRYSYVNHTYEQWFQRPWQEIIGREVKELLGTDGYAKALPKLERAMRGEQISFEESFTYVDRGRRDVWIRYRPYYDSAGRIQGIHTIISDITDRKVAERQLQRSNKCYKVLLWFNELVSQATDEVELLQGACDIISHQGLFPLAWIGRIEHDAEKRVLPIAQAGFTLEYLDTLQISWDDNLLGQGPTGKAVRSGKPQVTSNILSNPDYEPWRTQALKYGYASSIALPITVAGEVIAVLNIYAQEPTAFVGHEIELLKKLADDIGHGLHTLRLTQERNDIVLSLRKINRAYRTLVKLKKCLARQQTENELLKEVCQILIYSGSYHLAWIGYTQQDTAKTIRPVASAGDDEGYLQESTFSWGEGVFGRGPGGKSVRSGRTTIIQDNTKDPDFQPWCKAAQRRGYASTITIPLKSGGEVFGVIYLYADVTNAFHSEEVMLLEEFAEELSHGIIILRQQAHYQRTEGELNYQRKLFEAVVRHIPDTLVITDTEHNIISCNSALIRDFGYYPDELEGKTPGLLFSNNNEYRHQLRLHDEEKHHNIPDTFEYLRKDGSTFFGETMGAAFRNKDQILLGYVTIIRDISARLAMEQEHIQLEMQLQQAQKMETVGQLTGGIAHDFNNILASILGYTELALHRSRSPDGGQDNSHIQRYLGEIHSAGERARDIISQLLAFSRTDTSKKQPLQLPSLVEETVSLLKPMLSSKITLSLQMDEALPEIKGDANQLHQVLMNLCINARDAMDGRGTIDIKLTTVHHHSSCTSCGEKFQGEYLELSIGDSGPGIPDEVLARMFDPFFTTKEVGKGSGMGLSMVHGIVHGHNGHIQVQSTPQGATFHIYLPVT